MPPIGLDACLALVADRQRRRLLKQLRRDGDGETTIDDLVDSISRGEPATGADRPPDRVELVTQVYHTHLPKLADFGVVEYDPEAGTVRYLRDESMEAVLDSLPGGVAVANP